MAMLLTDEQRMLADAVTPFLARRAPVAHLRSLREDATGFDPALWRELGGQGLNAVLVPESAGGSGLGHVEGGIVLEQIGRNLTPSPFLMSAVGAVTILKHAPCELQDRWLPRIAAGEATVALALEEGPRHRPERCATTARMSGADHVLTGAKRFVVQGNAADLLLVVADDGIFAVEGRPEGLAVEGERLADGSVAARLTLSGVVARLIGRDDAILAGALAALRTGAAAELVGLASQALDMTIAYLKDRRQFGRVIGSFQALQHRAAHLHSELGLARAAVFKAQQLLDAGDPGGDAAASVAKAMAGLASGLAVREGVQMHGGIGMTDEHDIGLFMKRQRVLDELFGDAGYHADRLARLQGY
ncbi:MAG: hypothetical protein JWQ16_891 [Novosphingobium sp.]|nr:hypothetical protein [Novosphingobium sp.]